MKRPLATFDIDGTIFRSSLYIEFVSQAIKQGVFPADKAGKFAQQENVWLERTHPEAYNIYVMAVSEYFMEHLVTITQTQFDAVAKEVVDALYKRTYVYTRDLVHELAKTHFVVAISGSPRILVEHFAKYYPFNHFVASDYFLDDKGFFTGERTRMYKDKDIAIKKLLDEFDITLKGSVAVGDSAGDKTMLEIVDNPIAFNPEKELYDYARKKDWKIVVERKNVVYELDKKGGHYVLD